MDITATDTNSCTTVGLSSDSIRAINNEMNDGLQDIDETCSDFRRLRIIYLFSGNYDEVQFAKRQNHVPEKMEYSSRSGRLTRSSKSRRISSRTTFGCRYWNQYGGANGMLLSLRPLVALFLEVVRM